MENRIITLTAQIVSAHIAANDVSAVQLPGLIRDVHQALSTDHQMTPAEYRAKWGLPSSYPMVAAEYAAKRSKLAKDNGLGRKVAAPPPKKSSRSKLS